MSDNILSINNLSKNYHTKNEEINAIDNVSFNVKKGDFISIVGPSGCGKSTILSILCGLTNKSSGKININKNTRIGYMLQNDSLFFWKNVLDNCLIGCEINGKKTNDDIKYVKSLLINYGIGDFMDKYPNSLSGGMRQRVSLIRTLALKPDILLLDEPLSALDYQTRLSIGDDIYKIIKEENKTVIMVTHDIAEAISMSDKVIVLSNRPATIKSIYDIKLEKKSTPNENRKDKYFYKYYDLIWRDLNDNI